MSTLRVTNRNCTKCGVSELETEFAPRYSRCKPCQKEIVKGWNERAYNGDREKRREAQRKYYWKNREANLAKMSARSKTEKHKEWRKKNYKKNAEKIKAQARARASDPANRPKINESRRKYYATPRGKWVIDSSRDKRLRNLKERKRILDKEILAIQSSNCVGCGSDDVTIDHIVPLARGGRHAVGNLQPLCRSCNGSKGAMLMIEWRVFKERQAA
jgi:5-methylcytosine-specific restriction endonuclease McrA